MSELDFLLGGTEEREKGEERRENIQQKEKEAELREGLVEEKVREKQAEDESRSTVLKDNVETLMRKFINKDPKVGIWSYPSFILLQYLYNTVPGFKMSRVAKEALERGLKEMYPDLFRKAEEVYHSTLSNA